MPQFCEVALPVPLAQLFTYLVPDSFSVQPGMRVIVPFGSRQLVGVVVNCDGVSTAIEPAAIKPLKKVLDETPVLPAELLRLGQWVAEYYIVPPGDALAALLPPRAPARRSVFVRLSPAGEQALQGEGDAEEQALLRRLAKRGGLRRESLRSVWPLVEKLRRRGWITMESTMKASIARADKSASWEHSRGKTSGPHELSSQQEKAFQEICRQMESGQFGVFLLHGVTGSGKTEVYLRAIELVLQRQQSALMLVPEINLTPAMAGLFAARFGERVAILHSGLRDTEREAQWQRVREGFSDVVIGTRSAVFAPLDRLALVIVDEEQDASYKQEESPRYHGRDVALVRARQSGATVVLGSATPSLESRYNAERGKYRLLEIEQRVQQRPLAETAVVDMRVEFAETGRQGFFSRKLEAEIRQRLEQREQIMILLNRRGYSAFVLCRSCGQSIQCHNCSIALTHHRQLARLLCHYCGFARPIPRICPACASEHIYFVGEGSERIEESLHRLFPEARIGRLDRDTARGQRQAEGILGAFQNHELDILVGTQMIAKGHDIHRVTLAGVINADIGLARPDFRSAERTFQLLTQVSGRAGRGELPGKVVIQTYYPDHYAIRAAAAQDYALFYQQELRFRQLMHYPPFAALANLLVRSPSEETALRLAGRLGQHLEGQQRPGIKLLGPAAAAIHRLKKEYRYQFLLKAARRSLLREVLLSCREFAQREKFPAAALVIDVDPQSLL
ncbi:MAG: primosomal protein N' [Acidobacteria bacterium]|nr:primosomal protein N' [Acidobacteriota bacterium]